MSRLEDVAAVNIFRVELAAVSLWKVTEHILTVIKFTYTID